MRRWRDIDALLLLVEVVSRSFARMDRLTKRRFFQRVHVPEYWIVDPDARLVERWRPEDARPEQCESVLRWAPGGVGSPLELALAPLFAAAWREGGSAEVP